MRKSTKEAGSASTKPDSTIPTEKGDFLKTEYAIANQWAIHGENLSHKIFSFYVTLTTATLGGAIAIGQGLSPNSKSSFLVLGAACLILLFAGPVFYEALVRGHIRNVQYTERMSRIRYDLSQASGTPIGTTGAIPPTGYPIRELLLDPYQPSAIQHTLVAFINSILVALSIPSLLWGIASPGFRLVPAILSSIGALIVSLLLHRTATRILVRRHAANARP